MATTTSSSRVTRTANRTARLGGVARRDHRPRAYLGWKTLGPRIGLYAKKKVENHTKFSKFESDIESLMENNIISDIVSFHHMEIFMSKSKFSTIFWPKDRFPGAVKQAWIF